MCDLINKSQSYLFVYSLTRSLATCSPLIKPIYCVYYFCHLFCSINMNANKSKRKHFRRSWGRTTDCGPLLFMLSVISLSIASHQQKAPFVVYYMIHWLPTVTSAFHGIWKAFSDSGKPRRTSSSFHSVPQGPLHKYSEVTSGISQISTQHGAKRYWELAINYVKSTCELGQVISECGLQLPVTHQEWIA